MKIYATIMITIFALMQLIQIDHDNPKSDPKKEIKAPKAVMSILKRSCYDCHSSDTVWPKYSYIAPLSWTIGDHVHTGRKILNYSNWKDLDNDTKAKKFRRTIQTLNTALMPLPSYLWIHKDTKLTKQDKEILINWSKEELKKLGVETF